MSAVGAGLRLAPTENNPARFLWLYSTPTRLSWLLSYSPLALPNAASRLGEGEGKSPAIGLLPYS